MSIGKLLLLVLVVVAVTYGLRYFGVNIGAGLITPERKRAFGFGVFAALGFLLFYIVLDWATLAPFTLFYSIGAVIVVTAFLTWGDAMTKTAGEQFFYILVLGAGSILITLSLLYAVGETGVISRAWQWGDDAIIGPLAKPIDEAMEKMQKARPSIPRVSPDGQGAMAAPADQQITPDLVIDGKSPLKRGFVRLTAHQPLGRPPASVEEATAGMSHVIRLERNTACVIWSDEAPRGEVQVGLYVPELPGGGYSPIPVPTEELLDRRYGHTMMTPDDAGYLMLRLHGEGTAEILVIELPGTAGEARQKLDRIRRSYPTPISRGTQTGDHDDHRFFCYDSFQLR